ncbi:hypothetical protein MKX03_030216, partial [Papaver bracteatum]
MTYYNEKFVHKLINMHGFESDSWFCASILMMFVTTGDGGKFFGKFSPENSITMNTFLSLLILL